MIKRSYKDLEPYFPAGHFGVTCKRYHGKDETGAKKFWIGISEFEPGGGADWAYDDNPLEKVYFILEGEMTLKTDDEETVLHAGDSFRCVGGVNKSVTNNGKTVTKMLVCLLPPQA